MQKLNSVKFLYFAVETKYVLDCWKDIYWLTLYRKFRPFNFKYCCELTGVLLFFKCKNLKQMHKIC